MAADIALGGYYKNLLISSRTMFLFPPAESYFLDINRLRVELKGKLNNRVAINLQYDNEILLGDYLETKEFSSVLKNREPDTYFNLDRTYVDKNNLYGSHRLYRAYADLTFSDVDLRIGRQRIAWGTAMLWNPMDILNPFNPLQLERQERQGIDAVLLDWNYSPLSRVSLVYAQQRSETNTAARWRSNQKRFDLSFMAGRFRGDTVAGFDFAGQISEIGVRGEITQTDSAGEGNFTRTVVGADYTFTNTLTLNVEMYFNGQGAAAATDYDFKNLLLGNAQSLARHYLGVYLSYDITPLLRWDNILIINLDDDSTFIAPNLVFSLMDNLEWSAGMQVFNGSKGTEYDALENLYFVQLQWFF